MINLLPTPKVLILAGSWMILGALQVPDPAEHYELLKWAVPGMLGMIGALIVFIWVDFRNQFKEWRTDVSSRFTILDNKIALLDQRVAREVHDLWEEIHRMRENGRK